MDLKVKQQPKKIKEDQIDVMKQKMKFEQQVSLFTSK